MRAAARSECLTGIDRRRNVCRQPGALVWPFANTADFPEIFNRIAVRRFDNDPEANDHVVAGHALDLMGRMAKQRAIGGASDHQFKSRQWTGDALVVGMSKRIGLGDPGIWRRIVIVLEGLKLDGDDFLGRQRRIGTTARPLRRGQRTKAGRRR